MVSRRSLAASLLSLALAASSATPLFAGEWRGRHHRHHDAVSGLVDSTLPSIIPGLGTYSGAISALRVRGNGIYFSVSGLCGEAPARPRPKATIIDVSSGIADPCSYESGVCVIRPR